MKLQGRAIESFLARPDPRVRAVLVYGPDSGLVAERADTLARGVVADLADPFRVAELPAKAVAADPARLVDEAAALSFTGGRRLIRIREADDPLAAAFAALFKAPPPGDSLIVAEAGDLGARSKLRLAFEAADAGAAVPCYVEDEQALRRVIAELLAGHGLTVDADAQAYLAANLVGDRLIARSEIEKLALYAGPQKRIGLEEVRACVGDSASLSLDDPVWAAASGDFAGVDRALGRLFGEGIGPIPVLRTAQRHFQRLHLAAAEVAAGASAEAVTAGLKPPVFFKLRPAFTAQLRRWTLPQLRQALERLTEAEADCKRSHIPDETLCSRVLFQLAILARGREPRRS